MSAPPRVDAIPQEHVSPELDLAVRALLQAAFPATEEFRRGRDFRHPARAGDFLLVGHAGERLVASVALYFANATPANAGAVAGERFTLGCVGNVCSDPDPAFRGRGHAAACVQRALKVARARSAVAALLFCREGLVPYYERFGFREVGNELWLRDPSGARFLRDWHDRRMILPLQHPEWDAGQALELDVGSF